MSDLFASAVVHLSDVRWFGLRLPLQICVVLGLIMFRLVSVLICMPSVGIA